MNIFPKVWLSQSAHPSYNQTDKPDFENWWNEYKVIFKSKTCNKKMTERYLCFRYLWPIAARAGSIMKNEKNMSSMYQSYGMTLTIIVSRAARTWRRDWMRLKWALCSLRVFVQLALPLLCLAISRTMSKRANTILIEVKEMRKRTWRKQAASFATIHHYALSFF